MPWTYSFSPFDQRHDFIRLHTIPIDSRKFLCYNNPLPPELYRAPFFCCKKSDTSSIKHFVSVTLWGARLWGFFWSSLLSEVSFSRFAPALFKFNFKRIPMLEQPLVAWTMDIPKDSGTDVTSFAQFRFPSVTHSDTFKLEICSKTVHRISWVSALAMPSNPDPCFQRNVNGIRWWMYVNWS